MRPLTEADRPAVKALCQQQPEYNVFFLANLDKLSCDQDWVRYWGQFDAAGNLLGILMRYHVLWYAYDTPGADLNAFARVIESESQPNIVVNDNVRTAPSLVPLLQGYRVELDIAARLRRLRHERSTQPAVSCPARRATMDDVPALAQFYAQAPEDVRRGPDSIRRSIGGGRRTFLVGAGDEIVASALTTAELPSFAIMGGLYTPSHLREEDHLLAALSELVRSLVDEGKRACLVTRDPLVDAVCDQLGFEDVGPWRIVHLTQRQASAGMTG